MVAIKKRAMIVGIGGHAHVWKKALEIHPHWELAALVDTDTDKLNHAPQSWGVDPSEVFTSMEEAIQFGQKGHIDLAIIETPTFSHHVLAIEALELGLNVICEKNMASTISQGRQMVKAAFEHPELCTAIGTQTRFFPHNWTVKKFLQENKETLGPITSINMTYLYNWGKTRQGWRRWLPDLFLEDMAPHHLDLLRYLTEMDVVQVQGAVNFKPSFSYFKGSSSTFAIFALAMSKNYDNPDNWIYATYRGDWQKKGELYHRIDINCEGGEISLVEQNKTHTVTATLFDDPEGFQFHAENVPVMPNVEYNEYGYASETFLLEEMRVGIDSKGEKQPQTNFRNGYKTFAIIRGIVESYETGKAVFLPKYWKNLPFRGRSEFD